MFSQVICLDSSPSVHYKAEKTLHGKCVLPCVCKISGSAGCQ